jgi:hypothetical protein
VLLVLLLPWLPAGLAAPADDEAAAATPPAKSGLRGTIVLDDERPAAGARVLLIDMTDTDSVRYSTETSARGSYRLQSLQHGYYQIVIVLGERVFLGNRVLLLEPEKEEEADFTLADVAPRDAREGVTEATEIPALGTTAGGIARLQEATGPTGWAWFRTGKGVAVLIGSGAAVVAGLITLSDDEKDEPVISLSTP